MTTINRVDYDFLYRVLGIAYWVLRSWVEIRLNIQYSMFNNQLLGLSGVGLNIATLQQLAVCNGQWAKK
jgi:hypothetical protein